MGHLLIHLAEPFARRRVLGDHRFLGGHLHLRRLLDGEIDDDGVSGVDPVRVLDVGVTLPDLRPQVGIPQVGGRQIP